MTTDATLHLNPLLPGWLIALLAIGLLTAVVGSIRILIRKQVPTPWIKVLGGLRLAAVIIFIVALLQPIFGYSRTIRPKPELLVVIDTSKSMSLFDGERSRLDQATAALVIGPFAEHLRKNFTLRWYAADASARPITVEDVARLEAAGDTTRLADSLRAAAEHARADGPGARRLILVSDGADHGAADPAKLGVPVDVWPVGSRIAAPTGVRLAEVQASPRVLVGSETRFFAILRAEPAAAARRFALHLAEDGRDVQKLDVELHAGRAETRVEVVHRPESLGAKRYTLRLAGGDAAGEPYPVNVQVLDRTFEVLILEDTWRWEFKYLRRAVEDDPSFRFTAVLARGPNTVMQFGSPDRRAPLVGPPQNAADLAPFDLYILGDVNPTRWPRGLAAEIARGVKEEGKSLVVVAGPNLGKLAEQPDLHALLPVELGTESGRPAEGDTDVRVADSSAADFFFDPSVSGKQTLPPLERVYPPLRKKPGARVLLEASKLANSYGPVIVMAEQTVGRGRALFIGTDALWQWQTLAPPDGSVTPHRAFWQRALRALAPVRPVGDGGLWLLPERTRVAAGQPLTVWAEARGSATGGHVTMSATTSDEKRSVLATTADPAHTGRWKAVFTPLVAGTYRVTAAVRVEGQPAGEATTTIEVTPSAELADTSPDPHALHRISQASGGSVVSPDDPATWPVEEAVPVVVRRTVELWGDGVLLVMLIAVLGLDWLLRLIRGYV